MTEKTEKNVRAAALTTVEQKVSATAQAVALINRYLAAMSAAEQRVLVAAAEAMTTK